MLIAVIILSALLLAAIITIFVMGEKISGLTFNLEHALQRRREDSKRFREEEADHYKRHAEVESAFIRLATMFGLGDNYKGRGGFNLHLLLQDLNATAKIQHRKAAKKRLTPKK